MGALEVISLIFGVFSTVLTIFSMQCKRMNYVLALQLFSNSFLVAQYVIEGAVSAIGVALLAIAQVVVSFILMRKEISFPLWLTALFMAGYAGVTAVLYTSAVDLISCAAVWFFAVSIVQKSSAACRAFSAVNCLLWLTYDIFAAPTAIITHAVISTFVIVGIIRLDRAEWRAFFCRVLGKKRSGN